MVTQEVTIFGREGGAGEETLIGSAVFILYFTLMGSKFIKSASRCVEEDLKLETETINSSINCYRGDKSSEK